MDIWRCLMPICKALTTLGSGFFSSKILVLPVTISLPQQWKNIRFPFGLDHYLQRKPFPTQEAFLKGHTSGLPQRTHQQPPPGCHANIPLISTSSGSYRRHLTVSYYAKYRKHREKTTILLSSNKSY